jgi:hypothetical protein
MIISMEQTYRVVTSFNQSGHHVPANATFIVRYNGGGQQVGVEFDEVYFYGMHSCGGEVHSDRGFWLYRYLINDHCIPENGRPSWIL